MTKENMYCICIVKVSLLKNFRFEQRDKFFMRNSLSVLMNIWRAFEVDKNIVTQKFCEQN